MKPEYPTSQEDYAVLGIVTQTFAPAPKARVVESISYEDINSYDDFPPIGPIDSRVDFPLDEEGDFTE